MNKDLARTFISSHYRDTAVRLVIRGSKLYFLRKSKPLRRNCLIIANSDGYGKHTVLKPETDKGYDLGILSHVNQILSLYSPIPDSDDYSSYMRVPIFFNERGAGFYNTPAIVNNMSKLKRIAIDEKTSAILGSSN